MSRTARRRLFFALWPEPAMRQQLADLPTPHYSGPVHVDDLHLTALFLGQVPELQIDALTAAAGQVRLPAIRQPLVRLEAWLEPGVLCLVGDPVAPLEALRYALARAAVAAGLLLTREQQEFRPHVTLGRGFMTAQAFIPPPIEPLLLVAQRFSLAESMPQRDGGRYEVLASWSLE